DLAATPVGLLPLGAGAGLAAHLGLPADPAAAARIAVTGRPRRLDLLRSDGGAGIAVNAVQIGRIGWTGRPAGGLRRLLRQPGWPLHVNVDDQLLADGRSRILTVVIANGSTIDGRRVIPDADPADGALDVLVLGPTGRALAGTGGQPWRLVRSCCGRAVTVSPAPGVTVPIQVDGQVATLSGRRSWWVEPAAWSVPVPD
ncbi:MAG: lipid kinase, partial [Actinomycetota bacterium]|nr:lipid kinase [Actinomycetota bacterium]